MNKRITQLFFIFTLICSTLCLQAETCNDCKTDCCSVGCTTSNNLWIPHAFSVSMSREIFLQKPAWAGIEGDDGWHGAFSVGFEYMRNWGESKCCDSSKTEGCCQSIGAMPFWSAKNSNEMTIGNNSGNFDLDAYQLGLGEVGSSTGTVSLTPKIYQTGGDFFLYIGASRTERGFFAKAHGPVGIISVNPNLCFSEDLEPGVYTRGSLSSSESLDAPYKNIKEAFQASKSKDDKTTGFLKKMEYGIIDSDCNNTRSVVQFGDVAFSFGYNIFADEKKHIGIAIRFTAPTGNKAEGKYVLEPIFGRNGHFATGAEIIGHWRAWESDVDANYLDIWFDGTAEHLFKSTHKRSFDLKANGPGSKYLLVAKYAGGANATFQNCIENAINLTTQLVDSTFSIEGNFALMFDFNFGNWSWGLGYEGWARSCEKLRVSCKCPDPINLNEYVVLGRQTPYSDEGIPLNNAEPLATIGKSIDRHNNTSDRPVGVVSATDPANRIPENLNDALNICGQKAHAAYTSKAFTQAAYTWKDSDYSPFIGFMGSAEFSHKDNSAARFWSIGVQGGLAF